MIVAIDTDPGVDDALALMLALRSPELDVRLITTVAGNVTLPTATRNARRLIRFIDPSLPPPLAQGASAPLVRPLTSAEDVHGRDGLGGVTKQLYRNNPLLPVPRDLKASDDAVLHILELIGKYPNQVTVIALGPLTNIALALRKAPKVMRKVQRLIIMGGAVQVPGNITPAAEFNFYVDPEAARAVLQANLPITLIPLDVTRQVRLTKNHLITNRQNKFTFAVKSITESIRRRFGSVAMHDPLAVAVAINPEFVKTQTMWVGVECSSQLSDGASPGHTLPWPGNNDSPIEVAVDVDEQAVLSFFTQRVLSTGNHHARPAVNQAQVAVVGSANIDLSAKTPHLPRPGETVIGAQVTQGYGGKGANQAIAASRAGSRVTFACSLGNDPYGDAYLSFLHDQGILPICQRSEASTGVALISVNDRGENAITVGSGANSHLDKRIVDQIDLSITSVLVVQLEVPIPVVYYSLQQAKLQQVTTLLNAAPAKRLTKTLLNLVDVLVVNAVEAEVLSQQTVTTIASAKQACRKLKALGPRNVVITLGHRGVVALDEQNNLIRIAALKTKTIDTTGAGDTFVGYTASALAEGFSLTDALQLAVLASALSVKTLGAVESIPLRARVQRLMTSETRR